MFFNKSRFCFQLLYPCTRLRLDAYARAQRGGQDGSDSPGADSLWRRQITAWGAEKSQQCSKYSLQYSTFASEKLFRIWGANFFLALVAIYNLVTPLRICHELFSQNYQSHHGGIENVLKWRQVCWEKGSVAVFQLIPLDPAVFSP